MSNNNSNLSLASVYTIYTLKNKLEMPSMYNMGLDTIVSQSPKIIQTDVVIVNYTELCLV